MPNIYRNTLAKAGQSLLDSPDVAEPTFEEVSLQDVIATADIRGNLPPALIDYADPLLILLRLESQGDYTFAH